MTKGHARKPGPACSSFYLLPRANSAYPALFFSESAQQPARHDIATLPTIAYFRSMNVLQNQSLLPFNTFHIDNKAAYLLVLHTEQELTEALASDLLHRHEVRVIGGGSNILLTEDIAGVVLLNRLKGITILHEQDDTITIRFASGENWHDCVLWCVERGYGGIENLSLIPGTIGAAPIQNIGAYGVELKEVFVELEAMDITTAKKTIFTRNDCAFGYRDSIFKHEAKNRYIILSVTLQLSKQPVLNTAYGIIREELIDMGKLNPTLRDVSDAVIRIRQRKLPNPAFIGNAGSFFKNPVIPHSQFRALQQVYPDLPSYTAEDGVKIPAAWLIEHSHPEQASTWKGYREEDYGVHERQALCLVNYANASGSEIFALSERIITSVQQTFNILLEREVNIW